MRSGFLETPEKGEKDELSFIDYNQSSFYYFNHKVFDDIRSVNVFPRVN